MKKGLILVNAYTRQERSLNQSKRLKEELEKNGVDIDIKRNDFFIAQIDNDGEIISKAKDYDFCVYLDKDKYISLMLEKSGMRLFNSHNAIQACDDKMQTAILLAQHDIPMPRTLPGLLCYENQKLIVDAIQRVAEALGFPVIVKSSYGSLGKEVYKANDMAELCQIAEKLKFSPHLFQEFIQESYGKDIRVIVIGGKVAAAMLRQSKGDFRSNIELGGEGKNIILPKEAQALCEKSAHLLGLDYCGIDVLLGENKYYICEVNSNAFFGGIEEVTGINVAEKYAGYICQKVYGKD
ncbi:MAG: RimK family alpha-L-glutamate ligase [Clostridia bacterium]|nr:RimK family alpha-L-glutamate ligase [Clostridia bacterium]